MSTPLPPEFLSAPVAHRGLHDLSQGIPENSRAACLMAVRAGYGIEIDIQLSADDVPMVFHDYELDRLTGEDGLLRNRTAAELRNVLLRGNDEPIPTLRDILAVVDGRAALLIEIKDQDRGMGRNTGVIEARVAEALNGYDGPVAIMSFNPYSVAAFGRAAPHVARGLTTDAFDPDDWSMLPPEAFAALRDIPMYDEVGASFISHKHTDLTRPRVAELKRAGARILCWTIRSAADESTAREIAENITFEGYLPDTPRP